MNSLMNENIELFEKFIAKYKIEDEDYLYLFSKIKTSKLITDIDFNLLRSKFYKKDHMLWSMMETLVEIYHEDDTEQCSLFNKELKDELGLLKTRWD